MRRAVLLILVVTLIAGDHGVVERGARRLVRVDGLVGVHIDLARQTVDLDQAGWRVLSLSVVRDREIEFIMDGAAVCDLFQI